MYYKCLSRKRLLAGIFLVAAAARRRYCERLLKLGLERFALKATALTSLPVAEQEPKQKTRPKKGEAIETPAPKRHRVMDALKRAALRRTSTSRSRLPDMARPALCVARQGFPDRPAFGTAVSHAILTRVAAGELPAMLRLHRPGPMLAFSRQDRAAAGFDTAVRAAREGGFEPVAASRRRPCRRVSRANAGRSWAVARLPPVGPHDGALQGDGRDARRRARRAGHRRAGG